MSVFDQSRALNNQTMLNEFHFDRMGHPQINSNPAKVALSQQSTIDRRNAYTQAAAFRDIKKIQHKLEMRCNVSPDRNYSDATTATGSHDERKVSVYLKALGEIGKSNPECSSLFNSIHEILDSQFQTLLNKKKEENDYMTDKIEAIKKEIIEQRSTKEKTLKMYQKL